MMRGTFQDVWIKLHGLRVGFASSFKLLLSEVSGAHVAIEGSGVRPQPEGFPVFLCLVIDDAKVVHSVGIVMVEMNRAGKVFSGLLVPLHHEFRDPGLVINRRASGLLG